MNVQLHKVISDITGTTGMAIIRAIIAGNKVNLNESPLPQPKQIRHKPQGNEPDA